MAETLYIRIDNRGEVSGWRLGGNADGPLDAAGLDELAAYAATRRVVLLAPSTDLLLTEAAIPTRNRRRLLQALPFVLEDQLASDVAALHFAVGNAAADAPLPVAVVARERMDQWLGRLRDAGIQPQAVLPDLLAVPRGEDEWSLLLEDDAALLRSGRFSGFALEPDLAGELLEPALAGAGEARPARLVIHDARTSDSATIDTAALGLEVERQRPQGGALGLLAGAAHAGAPTIDLLQGSYSRSEQLGRLLRPWRVAAVLLVAALLLQLSLGVSRLYELRAADADLTARVEAIYRNAFPDAQRVVDARVQMERRLQVLRSGGSSDPFVELLAAAGPVLDRTPGLTIRGLRYKTGELEVDLTIGDFQGLDALKRALSAAAPVSVDIASASARGSEVESRVTIRGRSA